MVRESFSILLDRGAPLYYTLQNMTEYWNACTRPVERNGFGLSIAATENGAREIERSFNLLPDTDLVYREWRQLVLAYQVRGAKVHDARLVAVMRTYGIRHLLTFNETDFRRYPDIITVRPGGLL